MKYVKKMLYTGVVTLALAGVLTGTASAISIDDLLLRIKELTIQLDRLIQQTNMEQGVATPELFLYDLRMGVRNNADVKRLQQLLIAQGYLKKGNATGNFLALTRDAVKRLQSGMGVVVTGVFDKKTRDVVNRGIMGAKDVSGVSDTADGKTILIKTATSTALVRGVLTTPEDPVRPTTTAETYHIDPRPAYDSVAIEKMTFAAVNVERQKNGLSVLQWNEGLADVARSHSGDQAGDNIKITNPDVACLYPYIRHENFTSGFRVGDRLDMRGIEYVMAGENIIILPISKELIYRATKEASVCKVFFDQEGPTGETQDAARIRIQKSLLDRLSLMIDQQPLDWANKKWKEQEEIASESARDWMNSPGHRHNILTPGFEEGAIGAAKVNDYIILTQVFLKKP